MRFAVICKLLLTKIQYFVSQGQMQNLAERDDSRNRLAYQRQALVCGHAAQIQRDGALLNRVTVPVDYRQGDVSGVEVDGHASACLGGDNLRWLRFNCGDGIPSSFFTHEAPSDSLIAVDGTQQVLSPVIDLQWNCEVGFTALGFHGVGQTEIQNAFAGGVNDELTALVAEGFPLGPDHHKLATSRRPPSDEPFFVVSKPVLGEMVLSVEQLPTAKTESPGASFDVCCQCFDLVLQVYLETFFLVQYESILLGFGAGFALFLDLFDDLDGRGELCRHFIVFTHN